MSDLKPPKYEFPADIPGIVQTGTVCWSLALGQIIALMPSDLGSGWWQFGFSGGGISRYLTQVVVDLTNVTSRAHVAWWARGRMSNVEVRGSLAEWSAFHLACKGQDMTDEEVGLFRHIALRVRQSEPQHG